MRNGGGWGVTLASRLAMITTVVRVATGSALAVVPALLGQWAGTQLRGRLPPVLFRRLFFLALLVLGLQLAWRGLA